MRGVEARGLQRVEAERLAPDELSEAARTVLFRGFRLWRPMAEMDNLLARLHFAFRLATQHTGFTCLRSLCNGWATSVRCVGDPPPCPSGCGDAAGQNVGGAPFDVVRVQAHARVRLPPGRGGFRAFDIRRAGCRPRCVDVACS